MKTITPHQHHITAIETVGAHSKSIRDKNLLTLGMYGKPLFYYNAELAHSCPMIDRNYVISTYDGIRDKHWGDCYEFIPEDTSNYVGENHHHLCIAQAIEYVIRIGAPLDVVVVQLGNAYGVRMAQELEPALRYFDEHYDNLDGLMSLGNFPQFNLFRAHRVDPYGFARCDNAGGAIGTEAMYRSSCEYSYFFDGGFLVFKYSGFKAFNEDGQFPFMGDRIKGWIIDDPASQCMEIDSPWQILQVQSEIMKADAINYEKSRG
jgi:hypothetical protein